MPSSGPKPVSKILIIYDPHDKVSSKPEMDKRLGLKTASLSLADNIRPDEIRTHAASLVRQLMEQIYIDQGPK